MNLFDLHCDTFTKIHNENADLDGNVTDVNVNELSGFDFCTETFAVWVSGKEDDPRSYTFGVLESGKKELERLGILRIDNAAELKIRSKAGGTAAMLSLEGCDGVRSYGDIDRLYLEGVRTVSLTWNGRNRFAGGALSDGTLTGDGRGLLGYIGEKGMAADLAHLNRKSFFDAVSAAKHCVVTHCGIDAVIKHPRNLTDDQLICMKEKGGLVGICVFPGFIGDDPSEGFVRSIDRALRLGLEDNISVGTDFDGADMHPPITRPSDLRHLYETVGKTFGSFRLADKIFFKNAFNFYVNVLTNRKK